MKKLSGTSLVGSNGGLRKRVENDFYATPPESTQSLLSVENVYGKVLEPCVGQGHIVNEIKKTCNVTKVVCLDIVDRGYPKTQVQDFLTY